MLEILLALTAVLGVLNLVFILRRRADPGLEARLQALAEAQDRTERTLRADAETLRTAVERRLDAIAEQQERRAEGLKGAVEGRLDQIRQGVEERLTGMLEQRLGQSFKQVSERLEQVHRGLGEMQALATGVGDLRRVLTNVKTRGTWGEVQLGAILEQLLTPAQYIRDTAIRPQSPERVEFAIRLPGRDGEREVLLPIDAKFPQEDYLRLVEAADRADPEGVEAAAKALEASLRASGREIRDKYVHPPHSTDFAVMYLPTEGLYAEALRRPGLCEALQRDRVVVAGPTTLAALVNSLQMGFRTLAIQKRAGEVWQVLAAVKTEFAKFGDTLDKLHKKLAEAAGTVEDASHRSRQMEKRLRKVEALPEGEAQALLGVEE
jgi:DNA recombination protein RmuC